MKEAAGLNVNLIAATYLILLGPLAQRHDPRHLLLGDLDLSPAEGMLLDVTYAEVGEAALGLLYLLAGRHVVVLAAAPCVRR